MSNRLLIVTFLALGASVAHAEPPPATASSGPEAVAAPPAAQPSAQPPERAAAPAGAAASTPVGPSAASPYVTPPPLAAPPLRGNAAVPDAAVQVRLPVRPYAQTPEPRRHGDAGAPFALGIGPGFVWRGESGHDVFTARAYTPGLELFASYDVWRPAPKLKVAAGLGLRSERIGDDAAFALFHHAVQAELTARLGATRWLWPQLRLALGAVTTRFRLTDLPADDLSYGGRDTHVTGQAGAGVTLAAPARTFETRRGRLSSLSLGLLIDGGYTFAKAATLEAEPTSDADVARASFGVGSLRRSGGYLRTLAIVRF